MWRPTLAGVDQLAHGPGSWRRRVDERRSVCGAAVVGDGGGPPPDGRRRAGAACRERFDRRPVGR